MLTRRIASETPHILGINPWIHDFAAYDVWAKPLGLLMILSLLEQIGCRVSYIDCLNRFHPKMPSSDPARRYGRGPYRKKKIATPECLGDIQRAFSRYGIEPDWFISDLEKISRPDIILVTSGMTYWYRGVEEAIASVRSIYPDVPVVLGGIYATLYPSHAKDHSHADIIISGSNEENIVRSVLKTVNAEDLSAKWRWPVFGDFPRPAFHLQNTLGYVPLLTSRGCPFSCAYCASSFLSPQHEKKSPESVVDEILYWHKGYGVIDFAFYDDALLVQPQEHIVPIMESVIRSGIKVRFHTPNALHIRELTGDVTKLMYRSGFKTVRLGLETAVFEDRKDMDKKVTEKEFGDAVSHLKNAGFQKEELGAYLLVGLPKQSIASVKRSIETVLNKGITPIPAYYTPIPHTPFWEKALLHSRYDLAKDPLFTNNAVFPCMDEGFSWKLMSYLKSLTQKAVP